MTDNIKVIVRVRPFNQNEIGQVNVVEMEGQQVRLKSVEVEQEYKKFAFHRCYWSTDESLGKAAVDNTFVFNDIGKEVLEHIYQGYNSTIFAYGQTGSGKSYSIEGYEEKGLLQMCLEDIFMRKEKTESEANGMAISVKVTYLEIYNEKLRDLLDPKVDKELTIQSTGQQNSIFIKGVDPVHCNSYTEVEKLWKEGKKIRVIGAHAMNKNSSRSHAVFTIYYTETGKGKSIKARFNIVDLAGSERQAKTGATGIRLQEANNINKSLTNLGIVIEALARNCEKKSTKEQQFVPYRNSLLTHMLSESLAGNSKTFMIAAISPAQSNYEETLSTLRFAQRASLISTQSKKNVESKEVYNRELLEEVERLRKQLEEAKTKVIVEEKHTHSVDVQYITVEDQERARLLEERIAKMLSELQMNKSAMEELEKELKLEREKKLEMEKNRQQALKEAGLSTEASVKMEDMKLPYLMNISEDPTLAGMLIYHLKEGTVNIGTKEDEENDIRLNSLGIEKRHCSIIHENGNKIFIIPKHDSRVFVNGQVVENKIEIRHLDRIVLGNANTFKLVIPGEKGGDGDLRTTNNNGGQQGKYGEYLDDRLNTNTEQAKSIKILLSELEQRLPKLEFSKFIENFKTFYMDIDEANDITAFRYKKFPIKERNLFFKIKTIIDMEKYMKQAPELLIVCENKSTKETQFVWTEDKFQVRLGEMQDWYADVSGKASESTYVEFDPWFEAGDEFIREKEKLERMKAKELYEYWEAKQKQATEQYNSCLKTQSEILQYFKPNMIDSSVLESYGDSERRGEDIYIESHKKIIEMIKEKQKWRQLAEEFTDAVLEGVKCQQDRVFYNEMKARYEMEKGVKGERDSRERKGIWEKEKEKEREKEKMNPTQQQQQSHITSATINSNIYNNNNNNEKELLNKQLDELTIQNVELYQKIEELQYELKRRTVQIKKLTNMNNNNSSNNNN